MFLLLYALTRRMTKLSAFPRNVSAQPLARHRDAFARLLDGAPEHHRRNIRSVRQNGWSIVQFIDRQVILTKWRSGVLAD
jgi:hypothetical protein